MDLEKTPPLFLTMAFLFGIGSAEEAYNGMGENSASISGQGVPQWYGSAEAERPMSLNQLHR